MLALWRWPARDADDVRPPTVAGVTEMSVVAPADETPVANNPAAAAASAANAGGAVVPWCRKPAPSPL